MAYSLSYSKSILVLIFISDKTRRGETEYISTKVMSELLNIPKPTLSVILNNLIRAGILQSKEGANGGIRLIKREEDITLLDLLIAIENEKPLFHTNYDLNVEGTRPDNAKRVVNTALRHAEQTMKEELRQVSLRQILDSMPL